MTGVATVFKRVYGEALAPYGFFKIKGRQPYFGRLIGDEIIHIITFKNEYSFNQYYKAFDILGGITTVYSFNLELDESPRNNTEWLDDNAFIYGAMHLFDLDYEYRKSILKFEYREGSEQALLAAMKHSLEVTKKIMLSELNKVTDLKACMEYYRTISRERAGGLLNYKLYNAEEYAKIKREAHEEAKRHILYMIDQGRYTKAAEKIITDGEERMLKRVADFKEKRNNPEKYSEVMSKLECLKAENTEKLRQYGFDL